MADLAGLRVLVVEDEGGVALLTESVLEELGCHVTASVATLSKALVAARADAFDLAVLDVNLNGELVFPVAEVLRERQVPFIFCTGYGRMGVPETFMDCAVVNKPFTIAELEASLRSIVGK